MTTMILKEYCRWITLGSPLEWLAVFEAAFSEFLDRQTFANLSRIEFIGTYRSMILRD